MLKNLRPVVFVTLMILFWRFWNFFLFTRELFTLILTSITEMVWNRLFTYRTESCQCRFISMVKIFSLVLEDLTKMEHTMENIIH